MFSVNSKDFFASCCRPRITAAMLPNFIGKYVTMLGIVDSSQIAMNKRSFHLFVGDRLVEVLLRTPLFEALNDIVEVTGNVDGQGRLQCVFYRKYTSKVPFQLDEYNKAIELMHKHPQNYCSKMSAY